MPEIKTRMNEELLRGLARGQTNRAVLLYSGGVESTAAGLLLKEQGYIVHPMLVDYGQSSAPVERHLAREAVPAMGFEPAYVVETDVMSQLTKSKLLGERAVNDEDAWVPGRNTLFMVLAGIYAKQIDADGISIGYMLDDNFVFGDNDYFHHQMMAGVLSKSFLQPMEVFTPTRSKTKLELIRLLYQAKFLDSTVSCWNATLEAGDSIQTCHDCANCVERDEYVKAVVGT